MRSILLALCGVSSVALAVPMQLTHQGRLIDNSGLPYVGQHDVEVLLYDSPSAPAALWSETQTIDFDNGYFAVELGYDTANNPLADSVFNGTLLVAVAIDGGAPGPRQDVTSVPFAVRAKTATDVQGGVVDAATIMINGTTVIDSTGSVVADIQGATLEDLTCNPAQVPIFDGVVWSCVDASSGAGTVDWGSISGIPFDFADNIDNDTVGSLACVDGQGLAWNTALTAWECHDLFVITEAEVEDFVTNSPLDLAAGSTIGGADFVTDWSDLPNIPPGFADGSDADTQLDEAAVDGFVANNGYALSADLANIATSGDWNDLANMPSGFADGVDNDNVLSESDVDSMVSNNGYALDADLSTLGRTGNWNDITNMPADFADGVDNQLNEAAVDAFVSDNGYALDADISTVGKTGDWTDIVGVPGELLDGDDTLTEVQVDAMVANNGYAFDSAIATVGKTGMWSDLLGVPAGFADGVDNQLNEAQVDAYANNNGYAMDADIHTLGKTGNWSDIVSIPAGFADGVDNQRSEADVEGYVASMNQDVTLTGGPNRTLSVLANNTSIASIEARGSSSQGTGRVYVGQSSTYGGGMIYDGDANPDVVGPTDHFTLFRRTNGTDHEVMSVAHSSDNINLYGYVFPNAPVEVYDNPGGSGASYYITWLTNTRTAGPFVTKESNNYEFRLAQAGWYRVSVKTLFQGITSATVYRLYARTRTTGSPTNFKHLDRFGNQQTPTPGDQYHYTDDSFIVYSPSGTTRVSLFAISDNGDTFQVITTDSYSQLSIEYLGRN